MFGSGTKPWRLAGANVGSGSEPWRPGLRERRRRADEADPGDPVQADQLDQPLDLWLRAAQQDRAPFGRNRRASIARSSISDASANTSSDRSTITSALASNARANAGLRRLCVVLSSSPLHLNVGGVASKSTMASTYRNQGS